MFVEKTNNMLAATVGGIYLKTLVAIIVMFSILGQCEMSIYPGKLKIKLKTCCFIRFFTKKHYRKTNNHLP